MFTGGALPYKETHPELIAYGVTKNVVHSLALNIADKEEISTDATIVTILP